MDSSAKRAVATRSAVLLIPLSAVTYASSARAASLCCDTWESAQYAQCVMTDDCDPSHQTVVVQTAAGPCDQVGATPCTVSPYLTCCVRNCQDQTSCIPGSTSIPLSCCGGFCGPTYAMGSGAGTAIPGNSSCGIMNTYAACCAAGSVAVADLPSNAVGEWTVSFGDPVSPAADASVADASAEAAAKPSPGADAGVVDTSGAIGSPSGGCAIASDRGAGQSLLGTGLGLAAVLAAVRRRRRGVCPPSART
jgi:hypothetical protein